LSALILKFLDNWQISFILQTGLIIPPILFYSINSVKNLDISSRENQELHEEQGIQSNLLNKKETLKSHDLEES
jgi:hypothetical protein